MTKKFGFTLAEVLITLGIIGVVAAMTIPTLIANTNSAKFRSQFKKTLSTMNQAALMGQAQYDMNYGEATKLCADSSVASGKTGADQDPDTDPTICAILNGTLSGKEYVADVSTLTNTKGAYKITVADSDTGLDGAVEAVAAIGTTPAVEARAALVSSEVPAGHAYKLADGSLFVFQAASKKCTAKAPCAGFIDVNGITLPNKEVTCTDGTIDQTNCVVPNTAANMTDVYPVKFYDSTVEPATNAARYVLTTSK